MLRAKNLCFLLLILYGSGVSTAACEQVSDARDAGEKERVVLLHGLGRGKTAMWLLASRLETSGFDVVRISYASLSDSLERILAIVGRQIDACCKTSPEPVHFVGHSLGGLVIRAYLASNKVRTLGRVVLIATPNSGTPLVDQYRDSWWMDLAGPTIKKLGTNPESFPNSLPAPDYPVGVIAGVWETSFIGDMIPGDDDGLVPVESTRVAGMADFIIVESNHSFMRYNQEVARQTIAFLRTGKFSRNR